MSDFKLMIMYSQISIFNKDLNNPFNNWTDDHVRQGFSWRLESVSFKTLIDSGEINISVSIDNQYTKKDNSIIIIRVPFNVTNNSVEIASITNTRYFDIYNGEYNLYYESGFDSLSNNWCKFTFVKEMDHTPLIIKSEVEIISSNELIMNAYPA